MQPFPIPSDATHKIWSRLANWPQRHSSSNVWNFRHSRASNFKVSSPIRPEMRLIRAFMPDLVTSNFDGDSIKNERASMETAFSHYKSMGNFLNAQGQLTPYSVVRSGRNSNSSEILCMSSLPASIRIGSKTTEKRWRHRFPHYKSMGAFCCHGNQSFDSICPKTLCSLSPTQVMLHIKCDQDWPTSLRDIQVWKCGRRRTDDGPLVYHRLTLWAFGSGELKMHTHTWCVFSQTKKLQASEMRQWSHRS